MLEKASQFTIRLSSNMAGLNAYDMRITRTLDTDTTVPAVSFLFLGQAGGGGGGGGAGSEYDWG